MEPRTRSFVSLSPIALSTALALALADGVISTPWAPVDMAGANHCAPPPTCDAPPCDAPPCDYMCDCAGCEFADDRNTRI